MRRWSALLVVLVAAGAAMAAQLTLAQDEGADDGGLELIEDPQDVPAPAPAANPADEAAPAASGSAGETNQLVFLAKALGPFYSIVFLLLSVTLGALLVMNFLAARRETIIPVQLVEEFENDLNEKKYQEAYDLAREDDSFLGAVLSAGLGKLSQGYPQAIEAMQEVGEEENMKLEHRLSYIALIGTISPMVGLLGTVNGMVSAFQVIANTDTAPKPADLAEGISTALVTTLFGLCMAIPAIAAYGILRNRLARLVLEVGIVSEGLMSRFADKGARPEAGPPR
ncbi:MAG: MotA/TolQ/ExbB proton channel family protein [Pirellulales bacterium]